MSREKSGLRARLLGPRLAPLGTSVVAKTPHPLCPPHPENRVVLGLTQRLRRLRQWPQLPSLVSAVEIMVDPLMARPGEHHSLQTLERWARPWVQGGSLSPAKEPKPRGRLLSSLLKHRLPANVTVLDGRIVH